MPQFENIDSLEYIIRHIICIRKGGISLRFFETVMGKRFIEHTVPALVKAINESNKLQKEANELKAKELELRAKTTFLKNKD